MKRDIFEQMIDPMVLNARDTNGVPPYECMQLARLVGPCNFTFYSEDNQPWLQIKWMDDSVIVIGLEE